MLKYALLGFLNYGPMTGYDLGAFFDASAAHFWHARLSQIYTTLKRLEAEGLLTSTVEAQESRPDRRVYTITGAGRQALQEWLARPVVDLEKGKNRLLLKLFFARPLGKEAILTQLRLQRDLHRQQLVLYRDHVAEQITRTATTNPELAADAVMWEVTRLYGEMTEEMTLRWLDEAIRLVETQLPD